MFADYLWTRYMTKQEHPIAALWPNYRIISNNFVLAMVLEQFILCI